jgi:hypothetical protein
MNEINELSTNQVVLLNRQEVDLAPPVGRRQKVFSRRSRS